MKLGKCLTKITDINKLYLEKVINEGDIVVDATMGFDILSSSFLHLF